MNDPIRTVLDRLDEQLRPFAKEGESFSMYLLGRAALVLQYSFPFSTKDIDIVSTNDSRLERKAVELLGRGSALAQTLKLYLDPVPGGLPPLPRWFRDRCARLPGDWKVLKVWALEVHDLAATKLKCFRPQDREDLQMLCDRGLLKADKLRASLEAAFPFRSPKADDGEDDPDSPDWGKALANYKRVQAYLHGSLASL